MNDWRTNFAFEIADGPTCAYGDVAFELDVLADDGLGVDGEFVASMWRVSVYDVSVMCVSESTYIGGMWTRRRRVARALEV